MMISDLSGQRFGRLLVIRFSHRGNRYKTYWECRCDCGATKAVESVTLKSGHSKSCGCLSRERSTKHGAARDNNRTPEYQTWEHIKARCNNSANHKFPLYGGRGIRVAERWLDFATFLADMGPRPSPKHSIDRINNDGNYEPGNCRWATAKEQVNNRRPPNQWPSRQKQAA